MTFPTLRGDKVAQKVAEDTPRSKLEASYCVGARAFDLSIHLSATGQGHREQGAQAGGKEGKRMELIVAFLMGKERWSSGWGSPTGSTNWDDRLGQSRCNP